ncbi:MAG: VWA domain-containing protein [Nitrospirota bacterium]
MGRKVQLLLTLCVALLLALPYVALADTISPASVSASIDVGESLTVEKTVTVTSDVTTAKVDVFFLFDTTGSMAPLISSAQTNASTILSNASGLGDVAFGVGDYEDFPVSPYGLPGDVAYELVQDITTDATAAQSAIGSLDAVAGSGGDTPEANLYALDQVATTTSWRDDATKIVVWFGDAPGHDGDLEASYPSDIGLSDAIGSLTAENVVVEAIDLGGLNSTGQATAITDATGGDLFSGVTSGEIVTVIDDALASVFASYSEVSLMADGNLPGVGVSISPTSYLGDFSRDTDMTFAFDVTFTGLEAGTHAFSIDALVDGGIVAIESDRFTVGGAAAAVPEPATFLLVGVGLLGLVGVRSMKFGK